LRVRRFSNVFYVEFCDEIDPECNSKVISLDRALASAAPRWLLEAVPSYGSLALLVDMEQSTASAITDEIAKICDTIRPTGQIESGRLHRLPVRYGGEDAPDLGFVARSAGLSEEEVIQIHTSREYLCYMLGFTPGFAYLGNLDDRIAAPRLDTPRLRIAAGSVGIAGNQTGFYGVESPGGWRIIGKLQVVTFDVRKEPPSLVLPGDRVRFASVQ
jgi:KipI family sensor histidine kinase inhibitor